MEKIDFIYSGKVDLPENRSLSGLQNFLDSIDVEKYEILNTGKTAHGNISQRLEDIEERLTSLPCNVCDSLEKCDIRKNRSLRDLMRDFISLESGSGRINQALWLSFKRHLRFLKLTGFVDESDKLSPDGIWASKLRLDQPLLIAEAIRNGGFGDSGPEVLAGCIAPFVWDREQEVNLKKERDLDISPVEESFHRLIDSMENIIRLKERKGFYNASIMFWPAAAVYLWAKGISWDRLLDYAPTGEGDMASLVTRTADHLRQVENLRETHPKLASVAGQSIELILREPVLIN